MNDALERVDALPGSAGRAARKAALEVLDGKAPRSIPPAAERALREVLAGLQGARAALAEPCGPFGNQGSPTDHATDEDVLKDRLRAWRWRFRLRRLGLRRG